MWSCDAFSEIFVMLQQKSYYLGIALTSARFVTDLFELSNVVIKKLPRDINYGKRKHGLIFQKVEKIPKGILETFCPILSYSKIYHVRFSGHRQGYHFSHQS